MMVFKKWHKPVKKWQKMSEVNVELEVKNDVKLEENVGTTVVENEISNEIEQEVENVSVEIEKEQKSETKKVMKSHKINEIGTVWWSVVVKPKGRIAFEAQVAPVPLFKIPLEIRQYLINNGFNTDVYKKDKERLEKHWADMEMITKLKEFLTNMN